MGFSVVESGPLVRSSYHAAEQANNYNILALYDKFKQTKLIAFCMGQKGIISRIICTLIGSPLAYASLPDLPTAEGQISISEMKNFYELLKQ